MGKPANKNRREHEIIADDIEAELEYRENKPKIGPLVPRNPLQERLLDQLERKRIVIVTGPAGTGKTFVPTSWACERLMAGEIDRIYLTRPMVGVDEEMGFLPGTEDEKFAAWITPYLEVLNGKLGKKKVESYMRVGKIVARPLMMLRGMTFRNAVVLLDEAQNTTPRQMKMFMTRIGEGSTLVIDGDMEQSDLGGGIVNGLQVSTRLFQASAHFGRVSFGLEHIERDPIVKDILLAWREYELSIQGTHNNDKGVDHAEMGAEPIGSIENQRHNEVSIQ